jgi:hypothetical protein
MPIQSPQEISAIRVERTPLAATNSSTPNSIASSARIVTDRKGLQQVDLAVSSEAISVPRTPN